MMYLLTDMELDETFQAQFQSEAAAIANARTRRAPGPIGVREWDGNDLGVAEYTAIIFGDVVWRVSDHARADELAAEVERLRAQLAAGEWRPVTEKPVRWETVIITARERQSGKRYTMPAYYDDGEWCSLIIQLPLNDDVVCWQPLPAPPQE